MYNGSCYTQAKEIRLRLEVYPENTVENFIAAPLVDG